MSKTVKKKEVKKAQEVQALSNDDLKSIAAIIAISSQRGAIQASEMQGVGVIYNKVASLIVKE